MFTTTLLALKSWIEIPQYINFLGFNGEMHRSQINTKIIGKTLKTRKLWETNELCNKDLKSNNYFFM